MRFVSRFVRRRCQQARTRWRSGLRRRGAGAHLLATLVTLPVLGYLAFAQGMWFGVSFVWAGLAAVANGYIFRHQFLLLFVYLMVTFSHRILPLIARDTWGEAVRHQWTGALALGLIGLVLWLWSRDIQTGAAFTKAKGRGGRR